MSRLIAAIILLVFTTACCVVGNIAVSTVGQRVDSLLTAAKTAARNGDMDAARRLTEQAEQTYIKDEHKLFMFVYHTLVEDLGEHLAALPPLAAEDTVHDFLSQLELVRVVITHIERDNRPSLRSVF